LPLGFTDLAASIRDDASIYEETDFVWQRTWVEYTNRLAGALLGLALVLTFIGSLSYWQKSRRVVFTMLGIILITGFQGWLGSIVVSTNLLPGTITVHMLFAFLIIAGLMQVYVKTSPGRRAMSSFAMANTMRYAIAVLMILTLIQVLLGTQVRQQVDVIAKSLNLAQRELWIERLEWSSTFTGRSRCFVSRSRLDVLSSAAAFAPLSRGISRSFVAHGVYSY
jgi:cytochrome c oxidase assembly protein subunit 15